MLMSRRNFLIGLVAAPAVIRTPGLLMPVKSFTPDYTVKIHTSDLTWEAGSITPVRYVVLHDDMGTLWTHDYGEELTIHPGETITIDWSSPLLLARS